MSSDLAGWRRSLPGDSGSPRHSLANDDPESPFSLPATASAPPRGVKCPRRKGGGAQLADYVIRNEDRASLHEHLFVPI